MQEEILTKDEFLYALKRALSGEVSPEVFNENMAFYEDYISSEMRKGRTELEVMKSLGEPRLIAKTIIETSSPAGRTAYRETDFNNGGAQGQNYGSSEGRKSGRNIHIFSGWKLFLLLFSIIAVIVLILILIFKAIESLFYILGPLFVVLVLILLLRLKD